MNELQRAKLMSIKRRIYWRRVAIVAWVSFVAAAVATMVFFAMFDPDDLAEITTFPIQLSRIGGYSIGFLLFWLLTAGTGGVLNAMLALPAAKLRKPMPNHDKLEDNS